MLQNRDSWVQIKRGAEASIWRMKFLGKPCVAKVAEPKLWRVEQLDKRLRSERIQNEARSNLKCIRLGIPVAPIVFIDELTTTIIYDEMNGGTVKQYIYDHGDDESVIRIMKDIGVIVAKLHDNNIIHSDLTTSNLMLHNNQVRIIDFGLSFISTMPEDMAVDLYVLERAFKSSHPGKEHLIDVILESYQNSTTRAQTVMKRLKKVRSRGRKRSMVG